MGFVIVVEIVELFVVSFAVGLSFNISDSTFFNSSASRILLLYSIVNCDGELLDELGAPMMVFGHPAWSFIVDALLRMMRLI